MHLAQSFRPSALERRPVPPGAVLISVLALAIPVAGQLILPGDGRAEPLLWLTVLLPAYLLSYYRGWSGSLYALTAGVLILGGIEAGHWMTGSQVDVRVLLGLLLALLGLGFGIGLVTELLHRAREEAVWLAHTDPLTELPNRRYADEVLRREVEAARRGRDLVVVVFDIDDFKQVNDRLGHSGGDQVIVQVAGIVDRHTRAMNVTARYGGEEFLSVLSGSDLDGAEVFVQRVLDHVARLRPHGIFMTLSAGIAAYHPAHGSPEELVEQADRALYEAKQSGKGCYRIARRASGTTSGRRRTHRRILPAFEGPIPESPQARTMS